MWRQIHIVVVVMSIVSIVVVITLRL